MHYILKNARYQVLKELSEVIWHCPRVVEGQIAENAVPKIRPGISRNNLFKTLVPRVLSTFSPQVLHTKRDFNLNFALSLALQYNNDIS